MKYSVLMFMVPHGKTGSVMNAAVEAGSFGGTVFTGRRISENNVIVALGFGSSAQDVGLIVADDSNYESIKSAIIDSLESEKKGFGALLSVPCDRFIKNGEVAGEDNMDHGENELITVILNRGYADDAMAAARKAGAGGGTVVNARGTAREDDAKFFGMSIVPEKEMLMIVVNKEKKEDVMNAIKSLPCLQEKGSGVVFCSEVKEFTLLGK